MLFESFRADCIQFRVSSLEFIENQKEKISKRLKINLKLSFDIALESLDSLGEWLNIEGKIGSRL